MCPHNFPGHFLGRCFLLGAFASEMDGLNLWKNECREVILPRGLCRGGTGMLLDPGDTGGDPAEKQSPGIIT